MLKEFRDFIARGNVLDLAVAVIIGAAFATIATSLTEDVIMPIVGAIFGGLDLSSHFILLAERISRKMMKARMTKLITTVMNSPQPSTGAPAAFNAA